MERERIITETIDDLDNETLATRRRFVFDGQEYSIDLNEEHYKELMDFQDDYEVAKSAYNVAREECLIYTERARVIDETEVVNPDIDREATRQWRPLAERLSESPNEKAERLSPEPDPASPKPKPKSKSNGQSRVKPNGQSSETLMRQWAIANGVRVSKSGRVSKTVRDQFAAAHATKPKRASRATRNA